MKRVLTLIMVTLFLLVNLPTGACSAAGLSEIRARYSQPRGTKISWKIKVPSPPPAAVIVMQTIPVGTTIQSSSPPHNSFDPASGTVKWLLYKVKPGTIRMKMTLDKPIRKKGEIHGKIIFQDKSTRPIAEGSMVLKKRRKAIEGC